MSQNNNSDPGPGFVLLAMGAALVIFFVFLAFASLVLTIVAFFAWNNPVTIGKRTFYPHEARAFVLRGLAGLVLGPIFAIFCSILFEVKIENYLWGYIFLASYTLCSIGYEMMRDDSGDEVKPFVEVLPPPLSPPPPPKPDAHEAPFRFASWDDEEARQ